MYVWLVYGSWDYEGVDGESIRIFADYDSADEYANAIKSDYNTVLLTHRQI